MPQKQTLKEMARERASETHQSLDGISVYPTSPRHRDQSFSHNYHQECDIYITPKALASRIQTPHPTLIIDSCNPKKQQGIRIGRSTRRGSANHIQQDYGNDYFRSILEDAIDKRRDCNSGISIRRCFIVVYSTGDEDEEISLMTASRLRNEIRRIGKQREFAVKILKGGLDSWIRLYGCNRRLVEGLFDGNYGVGGIRGLTMRSTMTTPVVMMQSYSTTGSIRRDRAMSV